MYGHPPVRGSVQRFVRNAFAFRPTRSDWCDWCDYMALLHYLNEDVIDWFQQISSSLFVRKLHRWMWKTASFSEIDFGNGENASLGVFVCMWMCTMCTVMCTAHAFMGANLCAHSPWKQIFKYTYIRSVGHRYSYTTSPILTRKQTNSRLKNPVPIILNFGYGTIL